MTKKKIIIVSGATGSGKSSLALNLAKKFSGYLISADSRQVYKDMTIGTNKDKGIWKDEKYFVDNILEYLVDIITPDQEFNLVDWLRKTKSIINSHEELAIIVGGTGLYTSALAQGYELPGKKDEKLRLKLEKQLEKKGIEYLVQKLKKLDLEIESKVDLKNPRRVLRALEICLTSKEKFNPQKGESDYEVLHLAVNIDRQKLYEKINKRVDEMVDEGLVQEVESLEKKYNKKLPAFTGIGYRQIVQFLNKEIDLETAIELIKRDTRRYAKRQMTWYKRDENIKWVDNVAEAEKIVGEWLGGKRNE